MLLMAEPGIKLIKLKHNCDMQFYRIEVENIKCGGCMNTIQKSLMQINGVSHITINKETETIFVEGNDDIKRIDLINKLAALGYPEKGNNTVLHKAKSFVSCAVGRISSES